MKFRHISDQARNQCYNIVFQLKVIYDDENRRQGEGIKQIFPGKYTHMTFYQFWWEADIWKLLKGDKKVIWLWISLKLLIISPFNDRILYLFDRSLCSLAVKINIQVRTDIFLYQTIHIHISYILCLTTKV